MNEKTSKKMPPWRGAYKCPDCGYRGRTIGAVLIHRANCKGTGERGGVSMDLACVMAGLAISLAFWGLLSAWLVPGTVTGDQSSVIGEAVEMDRLKAEIESLTEQVAMRERNCDDLVNSLNSAIAERNEAVALLRSLMSIDEGPPEAAARGERRL